MGSRERKRAARQKRKTRSAERQSTSQELADEAIESATSNGSESGADLTSQAESASERKNREAREALEPLEEGERPTVVTVAAVICNVLVIMSALGYALWDVVGPDDPRPQAFGVVVFIVLFGMMAYGLWKARYWAVLGFQATLVLVIISSALGLVASLSLFLALGSLILMVGAGTLFYFMIKAWARIQMPTPPGQG